jgi:16S rRNA (cytidine1402-2'-O)-methyltransferase
MFMAHGRLYLLPSPLGDDALHTIPPYVTEIICNLDVFIVEKAKTARRFLKALEFPTPFDDCLFFELNKRTQDHELPRFLAPATEGRHIGLLSEAGVPAVADPGSKMVRIAHQQGIEVVPLVGPSSLLLALMASGMNGQRFTFHGYLSPQRHKLAKDLKRLESQALQQQETQLFIETPYRNMAMLETALQHLAPVTYLTVAVDLTLPTQQVFSHRISDWQKRELPDLHKRPAVFLLGR